MLPKNTGALCESRIAAMQPVHRQPLKIQNHESMAQVAMTPWGAPGAPS
jgi:hypothetical protein